MRLLDGVFADTCTVASKRTLRLCGGVQAEKADMEVR